MPGLESADKLAGSSVELLKRKGDEIENDGLRQGNSKKLCGVEISNESFELSDDDGLDQETFEEEYKQIWRFKFIDDNDFSIITFDQVKECLDSMTTKWKFIAFVESHKGFLFRLNDASVVESIREWTEIPYQDGDNLMVTLSEQGNEIDVRKGVMLDTMFIPYSINRLEEYLKPQGVLEVQKVEKIDSDGRRYYTGTVICLFDKKIPEFIDAFGCQMEVKEYVPRPMICYRCGSIGHTARNCVSMQEPCRRCYEEHDRNFICDVKCKNCGEPHYTNSRFCEKIMKETEILRIQFGLKMRYREAVTYLNNSGGMKDIISSINESKQEQIIKHQEEELKKYKEKSDKLDICIEKKSYEAIKYVKIIENLKSICDEADLRREKAEAETIVLSHQLSEITIGVEQISEENKESRIQIDKLKESLRINSARCLDAEKRNKEWKDKADEDKSKIEKMEKELEVAKSSFDDFVHHSDVTKTEYRKYLKSLDKKKDVLKIKIRE